MSKYSLNDAPKSESTNNSSSTGLYQKVGIYDNVRISDVVLGKSSLNHVPFIELQTIGAAGEKGKSARMWLSTTVKPGNKTSGWGMTARNIKDLIVATHNISEEEARSIDLIPSDLPEGTPDDAIHQMLVNKVASLLVGRPFRAKFKGEESKPREGNTSGLIFATMDLVESMNVPKAASKLRFSETRDIKYYVSPEQQAATTAEAKDDLPF